eukprot:GSChrysophyteH1.ASY1.ANO1.1726.1 assembled CDS
MSGLAELAAKKKRGDAKELAAERKMEEEKKLLKEKMDTAGLSFENHELPDEDLTQDDVAKSWWQSMKGIMPWTDEYFEAEAAEDEMDDLKAIRVEKAKATDLLALTKTGRHEEALASMMAETNNDFFLPASIQTQHDGEGKWEFEEPELNPFGVLEAQQRRNRVRRAFRSTYSLTSNAEASALEGTLNAMNKAKQSRNTSTTCNWKGKNKAGEYVKCTNDRFPHPHKKEKNPETRKEGPVLLDTCAYHAPNCVEDHDESQGAIEIRVPNKYAMCTECHVSNHSDEPMQQQLKMETCPGVAPAASIALPSEEELDAALDGDEKLTEDSICAWVAGRNEVHIRGWQCANKHTGGGSSVIETPNEYGLCENHYTAEHGDPPLEPDFPYPGMIVKKPKNAWMTEGHHWAAPKWAPNHPRYCAEYEPPEPPEDFVQSIIAAGKYAKFIDRKRREGKRMAAKIQATFRRFRVHNSHHELSRQKNKKFRLESVILMQCTARRRMAWNVVNKMRIQRNKAALLCQTRFRGYIARKKARERWAGRRIMAFFRRLRFLKFKDAVIVMMQLRKMSRRRHGNALELQRVYRGYRARLLIFEAKLWKWVQNRSARLIVRELKAWIERKDDFEVEFVYPTMAWAKKECGKRIAKLIWKLICDRRDRAQFCLKLARVAVFVQRHVRGFIARKGTNKMLYLHKQMQQWIKPEYTEEFTQRFFESNIFYLKDRKKKEKKAPPPPPKPTWLLRPLLPEKVREDPEVSDDNFMLVIAQWYKSAGVPLLQSEIDALKEEFANPASGKVVISQLEDYIMLSELPCRKHGRRICGKCMFRARCSQKNCSCVEYLPSKDGNMTSICKNCFHAPDIHRRMPIQIKEAEKPRTMLSLMRSQRDPDTSMPSSVKGMDFDDIIVPPEDPDDVQMRRYDSADLKTVIETTNLSEYRASTLALMLMFLEEKGENISKIDEYWGQSEVKIVGDMNVDLHGRPVSKGDKAIVSVPIYPVPPRVALTSDEFWDNSAKNPNKSKRDYDEKFDHNMPMPVTQDNDIVYTFEGSKVYLNLLIQIIEVGEGKVPGAKIGYDEPDFLRLITNHIQIFERHWRKMVADLRKGVLNRNAVVNKKDRLMFEALALPRVALSKQLDEAFRDLGFHTKGMGKDIVSSTYAQRIRWAEKPPLARRPSLPHTPGGTGLDGRDVELRASRDGNRSKSPMRGRSSSPVNTSISSSRAGSPQPDSRPGTGKLGIKSKSRRDLLVMVGDTMKHSTARVDDLHSEERTRGPSRRVQRDGRRGSDTDILRDVTSNELHSMNTEQETAARTGYHFTIQTDGDRFICPFPACGQSFKSKDAAFRHLPVHEQRVRLYAPTALPDSHMQFYWPRAPPWNRHEMYREEVQPVGNSKCEWPGCNKSFATQEKLDNHMRMVHGFVHPSSVTDNKHYQLMGTALCVPPFKPPEQVKFAVNYCEIHLNPNGGCMKCINIELLDGPKPPYRFFEGFSINLKLKAEAAKAKLYDMEKAILYRKMVGIVPSHHLAYACSVMTDKDNNAFIGCRPFLDYQKAIAHEVSIPRDFDKQHELIALHEEEEEDFEWIAISQVQNVARIVYVKSKKQFQRMVRKGSIPENSYFIRE